LGKKFPLKFEHFVDPLPSFNQFQNMSQPREGLEGSDSAIIDLANHTTGNGLDRQSSLYPTLFQDQSPVLKTKPCSGTAKSPTLVSLLEMLQCINEPPLARALTAREQSFV
jgi:hypothetical protein